MPLGKSGAHYFNPKVMEAKGDMPDADMGKQPEMVQCPSCGAEFPLPPPEEKMEEQVSPGIHDQVKSKMASDEGEY